LALAGLVSVAIVPQTCLVHAKKSKGCKKKASSTDLGADLGPGESTEFTREVPGTQSRTHRLTLPNDYDGNSPSPLMLYFHGYGGDYKECGNSCVGEAAEKGFVSVTMTGYEESWNFAGSTSSPGPDGATCSEGAGGLCDGFPSCDCTPAEDTKCWWTTCHDSVEQVLSVLDEVQDEICIDLDQVWAVGCSNGGMFTFELASDERSASRLAGIVPIVGLPHNGYSKGPLISMPMFGMYGKTDTNVPPISNTDDPYKTSQTSDYYDDGVGWYYTSLLKVMMDWTEGNGCDGNGQEPLSEEYGISKYEGLTCTQGCSESKDTHVVGCIFDDGHVCDIDEIWEPAFNFMLAPRNKSNKGKKKGKKKEMQEERKRVEEL